jgi:hypothetical protein
MDECTSLQWASPMSLLVLVVLSFDSCGSIMTCPSSTCPHWRHTRSPCVESVTRSVDWQFRQRSSKPSSRTWCPQELRMTSLGL